jgi:acyl-CoA dehydrogenase
LDFDLTERQAHFRNRVRAFIERYVRPAVPALAAELNSGERWHHLEGLEPLKEKARAEGLWNLFMPPGGALAHVDESFAFEGEQLTNLEYALCAEEMGRVGFASEVFNCSAPDTGNMEVLHRYGTREHKEQWLAPLMRGQIRSAFLMTGRRTRVRDRAGAPGAGAHPPLHAHHRRGGGSAGADGPPHPVAHRLWQEDQRT